MRESLRQLIEETIVLKYTLPNEGLSIERSKVSTDDDACYSAQNNENLSRVIYNSLIEYAFNEYEIEGHDFGTLHRRALTRKVKWNSEATEKQKLTYGFYGEVLLYCMLHILHGASPIIARGHLFNILENSETKGYDSYHLIETSTSDVELWFGEVKFGASFASSTTGTRGALTGIEKAISDDYLNDNLIAISERTNDLALQGSQIEVILDDIKNNPEIQIAALAEKYSLKLMYPILIAFDQKAAGYDQTIKDAIKHLEDAVSSLDFSISIEVSVFFMLVPLNKVRDVKIQVVQWIEENEPLIS